MALSFIELLNRYNYPKTIAKFENIKAYQSGEYTAVLGENTIEPDVLTHDDQFVYDKNNTVVGHYHNGVYVSLFYWGQGINDEYLDTPIEGKIVYAPLVGSGEYLPTGVRKYLVYDEVPPAAQPENYALSYKRVFFGGEKTLADLYKNAFKYQYLRDNDSFMALNEHGVTEHMLEVVKETITLREYGSLYSRIEKLSIILCYILGRIQTLLPEDERAQLNDLLAVSVPLGDVALAGHDVAGIREIALAAQQGVEALRSYTVNENAHLVV
ncbi:hypothetical protein RAH42_10600 [Pyramidobacter sp. YE332]|uniref:hypothetical protein n=1 Tax=Pyramidobacter sp. YE332 TaxID=3068894 RepID=UPI00294B079C|nr:hypothetical protein [Pyramidobacter sp. YE332]WOL39578.1 hypothetical protein RAH42_10600 [Pyramidobacter sp. YE332]